MKNIFFMALLTSLISGCAALQVQPYTPAPEGAKISANSLGGYSLESYQKKLSIYNIKSEVLEFCYAQNVSNPVVTPVLNPKGNKITVSGREQVIFIIPRTMGTPLNYDLIFNLTTTTLKDRTELFFDNLKVKGTWSANENPFPGTRDTKDYVESAIAKMDEISSKLNTCFISEK